MGAVATLLPSYGTVEEHPITDAQHLKNVLRAFEGSMADTLLLTHPEPSRLWEWFSARFAFVHAAGGAVTDERGRLLAMYRRNRWDLPKGKLDKGEAVPDAAVREVMEECGLKHVEIVDTIADGSHTPLAVTWHTYDHKGGHYQEHNIAAWMRTLVKRAGLSWQGTHILRKTCGTRIADGGGGVAAVATHLRHKNLQTASRYIDRRGATSRALNALES